MIVLAHGFGGRTDLPVPFWLALYGAGIAVVVSFAALGVLWPEARLRGDAAGRALPPRARRLLDSAALRRGAQAIVLVAALAVVAAAAFGPADEASNAAPYALYIVLWVGVLLASAALGGVWRAVNPLRVAHRSLTRLSGGDPEAGFRTLPERLGYWPAVAGLVAFTWLELVPSWRADPDTVVVFLCAYGALHLAAAQVYGERWFDRGDAFEVYFGLVGALSPLGRRSDGQWVVRNPLDGLAGVRRAPGLVAVVAVLIGSTGFDGVTRTAWWQREVDADSLVAGSAGLAAVVLVVALGYVAAARAAGRIGGTVTDAPARFAHTVVPIALGYAIAHYVSLLLYEGQLAFINASDPLGRGWNLLGLSGRSVEYSLTSAGTIAVVQVGAIIVGHVLGVVAAHDLAVRLFRGRAAVRSQYPLLVLMVGLTVGGVALLLA